ncbi:hypothetical protein BH747_09505 [Enterococcus villorum]|uniref:Uncharacterized protein n=1 Tax=Enterococcus villorum TaxID=112904 RepID=A0A1V8YB30_9ENTE|nr:hypothetical protein [Enterococcus villorum]OQO69782.1 hypothetical protein BH747_09505 [Enterococcus villorum]OQO74945.1 hypothetical protein BH744_06635 [Enterococcus villorum]
MFEILTMFFVYLISLNLAAFLGVALLAFYFQLKKRNLNATQEKWQGYLQKIGPKGIVQRLHVSYMIALSFLAIINYNLTFKHSVAYTVTLLIAGIFHLTYKYQLNKNNLTKRFN